MSQPVGPCLPCRVGRLSAGLVPTLYLAASGRALADQTEDHQASWSAPNPYARVACFDIANA